MQQFSNHPLTYFQLIKLVKVLANSDSHTDKVIKGALKGVDLVLNSGYCGSLAEPQVSAQLTALIANPKIKGNIQLDALRVIQHLSKVLQYRKRILTESVLHPLMRTALASCEESGSKEFDPQLRIQVIKTLVTLGGLSMKTQLCVPGETREYEKMRRSFQMLGGMVALLLVREKGLEEEIKALPELDLLKEITQFEWQRQLEGFTVANNSLNTNPINNGRRRSMEETEIQADKVIEKNGNVPRSPLPEFVLNYCDIEWLSVKLQERATAAKTLQEERDRDDRERRAQDLEAAVKDKERREQEHAERRQKTEEMFQKRLEEFKKKQNIEYSKRQQEEQEIRAQIHEKRAELKKQLKDRREEFQKLRKLEAETRKQEEDLLKKMQQQDIVKRRMLQLKRHHRHLGSEENRETSLEPMVNSEHHYFAEENIDEEGAPTKKKMVPMKPSHRREGSRRKEIEHSQKRINLTKDKDFLRKRYITEYNDDEEENNEEVEPAGHLMHAKAMRSAVSLLKKPKSLAVIHSELDNKTFDSLKAILLAQSVVKSPRKTEVEQVQYGVHESLPSLKIMRNHRGVAHPATNNNAAIKNQDLFVRSENGKPSLGVPESTTNSTGKVKRLYYNRDYSAVDNPYLKKEEPLPKIVASLNKDHAGIRFKGSQPANEPTHE
eukprot:TRINITY_DN1145_c0_g1_i1.p1 TRINITY_DN1145_c0_g1~~TRINITY_DN1145_c0_g1_i1.p1  ORF type:complete len:664 (-),score=80.54 TRINITY_DN1145_c0_g1_i1:239-2230(-)